MAEENYMPTLVKILDQLKEKGYTADFILTAEGLLSKNTNEVFKSSDLVIDKVYRFEGDSSADDMSVMYAISSGNGSPRGAGTKGVLIDAYGTYENEELAEFLKSVKAIEQ